MYKSDISAKDFITDIKSEADISVPVTDFSYVLWLNALEQLLYSEIILESRIKRVDVNDGEVDLSEIIVGDIEADVVADDVVAVYSDTYELEKCSPSALMVLSGGSDGYYIKNDTDKLKIYDPKYSDSVYVLYTVRPRLKTIVTVGDNKKEICADEVCIPVEYLTMASAKLRGEAYKLANEDELAAKWLADFNVQMENFKVWSDVRNKVFGERRK